jgi:hypothetical protein
MGKSLRGPIVRRLSGPSPSRAASAPSRAAASHRQAIESHPEDALPPPTDPKFALAISHTPWNPPRVANMVQMRAVARPDTCVAYREITERMPNWQWSGLMWQWASDAAQAHSEITHAVFLQDDLMLHPEFQDVLRAVVTAVPNRLLSLMPNHPYARRSLARSDAWYLTSDCLGSGYVFPIIVLDEFLRWRSRQSASRIQSTCEDYLVTCWVNATGRRTWHTVPGLIDHRRDIETTNPSIGYTFRRSYAPWTARECVQRTLTDAASWAATKSPLDFGFDPTGAHPEFPLGMDPVRTPSYQDRVILAEHNRIERAEAVR